MYFAMDDIGLDNMERLERMGSGAEKWALIERLAGEAGFEGIQVTPSLYEQELGIDTDAIPSYIRRFRLVYHAGGMHDLSTQVGMDGLDRALARALRTSVTHGMEDVSIHPPAFTGESGSARQAVREGFRVAIEKWLPRYAQAGMPLTVETHVTGAYFVFQGLADYAEFVGQFPGLGVLIDVSHNCYDGYSEQEILALLEPLTVRGLHLSDAIPGADFRAGTHLPIGEGKVDFRRMLAPFADDGSVCGALEIMSPFSGIVGSLERLRRAC